MFLIDAMILFPVYAELQLEYGDVREVSEILSSPLERSMVQFQVHHFIYVRVDGAEVNTSCGNSTSKRLFLFLCNLFLDY